MSKATLEESEKKYPHIFQEEENDDDFNEHYDIESEKNKIVEYSPKGRFVRFNEELGSGAYKTVYKAYDNETGWEVAWNIIKLQRLPDKERKRISDEIALLKQLKHPNIIHFISAWINRQREEVVFITEVVTGGSLKRFMKKIKVPRLKVIKTWCREILQGIDYLHNLEPHPIIHRDIKCDNIFINSNKGEIRIGDLGLATFMSHAYADSVLGTPEFMAPEMYEEVYGPSVDIYSFGMCVLEMVTNETPYKECMNPAQIYKKVSKGIKPFSLNQIANEQVRNFISECLKPKDERPTATELLKSEFLNTVDPELDNQPVQLYETPQVPKIDEEESIKGSLKANEKMTKLYQQALEEGSGSEKEADEVKSDQNEERKQEERKAEFQASNAEVDASYELKKKAVSEKIVLETQAEKAALINIPKGQSFGINEAKVGQKPVVEQQEEVKREYLTQKSQEVASRVQEQIQKSEEKKQPETIKDSHEIERYKSDPTGKMPEHIRRMKEHPKSTTNHDDDARSVDMKKAQVHGGHIHGHEEPMNRESHRYHFVSKGMVNNYLVIAIRYDQYEGGQNETIIEIHRDKIYPDKIMKKLYKHLDIGNPSDHYFTQQFNALIDALIVQNLLQTPNVMFGSSAYAKSVTNESQRSPDRSVLTTNPNSVYFQPKNFNKFYKKYLSEIPKEYLMLETEEAMNLRHQREIMELENNHLAQKRNLWDRRQNIMSNNSYNGVVYNGFQVTTLDTDDFYHKLFQLNEISYRSEIKKKGSRGTEFSISSVDSATLSPTCSSGNNIHSISNWTEINIPMPKKEEIPTNMLEEISKLQVQTSEVPSDTERLSSNVNLDQSHQTPKSQVSSHQQLLPTIISPKAGTMNTKQHSVSNFAMHAMKQPSVVKTQSDKSGQKEKRSSDASEKDAVLIEAPQKRSSIEKTPEAAHQLAQTLLQSTSVQYSTHHTTTSAPQHSQIESEKAIAPVITVEQKKEVIYEKLTINTNNSSPAEKGSQQQQQPVHEPRIILKGSAQTPVQQSQPSSENKKSIQTNLNILVNNPVSFIQGTSTPTNAMQNDPSRPGYRSNTSVTPRQNANIAQALPVQPNSATIKGSNTPANQQPVLAQNSNINKQATTQSVQANPLAQKLTLNSAQNSAGNLTKPNQPVFTFPSNKSAKNLTNMSDQSNKSFSQSTHMKLQSAELIEKIKNYKIKGVLKRNDPSVNTEDVKMLQTCLELLTDNDILLNGNFNHYTENLLKSCQESLGLVPDGVVDEGVWEKIIVGLEKKIEKRKLAKLKETGETGKEKDDMKKKIKDKQNKEASECLTKIESNLVDLSDLK